MAVIDWTWSLSDWFLLFLAIGLFLYFYGTSNHSFFKRQDVPYLQPYPFVGNVGKMLRQKQSFPDFVLEVYNKLKDYQYGGMFMFKQPFLVLTDPELIKTVTVKDFESFTDHRTFFSEDAETLWGKGLVDLKGQKWKNMRSTLSPAFTSSKMKTMFVLIDECCQQFVQFLEQCYQQMPSQGCNMCKEGELLILELKDFYTRYANDVIATTAFGIGVDSLRQPRNEFYMMSQDATNIEGLRAFKFLGYSAFPRLMKTLGISAMPRKVTRFFRSLVHDTIATREREGIVRPDMLQLLIEAKKGILQDENSEQTKNNNKINLDDEDVLAQALLFILAGFDTSSTLLCFATYQLALHPDVQTRLQEEIEETLQENKGKFTYEAIQSMKYLDMVVSETLRLNPPSAAVDRVCVKSYILEADPPYQMLPGDIVFIPTIGLHRDSRYYADPERFDPERFSDDNKQKINPMAYLPFGVGPRSCIGSRFALMETKMALVHLFSRFNVKVVSKTPVPMKIVQKSFSMTIEGGFWLGLEKRNS